MSDDDDDEDDSFVVKKAPMTQLLPGSIPLTKTTNGTANGVSTAAKPKAETNQDTESEYEYETEEEDEDEDDGEDASHQESRQDNKEDTYEKRADLVLEERSDLDYIDDEEDEDGICKGKGPFSMMKLPCIDAWGVARPRHVQSQEEEEEEDVHQWYDRHRYFARQGERPQQFGQLRCTATHVSDLPGQEEKIP